MLFRSIRSEVLLEAPSITTPHTSRHLRHLKVFRLRVSGESGSWRVLLCYPSVVRREGQVEPRRTDWRARLGAADSCDVEVKVAALPGEYEPLDSAAESGAAGCRANGALLSSRRLREGLKQEGAAGGPTETRKHPPESSKDEPKLYCRLRRDLQAHKRLAA